MSIQIEINAQIKLYEISNYSNSEFILQNENHEVSFETPLKLDNCFEGKEFDLYFLAKKNVNENDIFQVYDSVNDKRIGWIIPINSLESNDHDHANNQHFLKYAYIAIRETLKKSHAEIFTKELSGDIVSFRLSDIFDETTVVLIISKETLVAETKFDIERATPSLMKYGYAKLGIVNPGEIDFEANTPENKKVKIELMSEDIESHSLISDLLNHAFAYEKNTVFKFFFLYQVIELLIDSVYKNEQETMIGKLLSASGDSGRTKDELENLRNFMSEKVRLNSLINKYTNMNGSELNELKIHCNSFLTSIGRNTGSNFEQYYYPIRNFLFHQYRDFQNSSEPILNNIIKETIEILPTMLSRYSRI